MMRPVRAVFILVLSLTSLPLFAQIYRAPETDAPSRKPAAATVKTPDDGVMVAIDPATGALRQPTKAEVEALTGAREKAGAPRALRLTRTATGMTMVELDDSFLEYLTVRRDADGRLHAACVHAEQVPSILRLPVPAVQPLEEK